MNSNEVKLRIHDIVSLKEDLFHEMIINKDNYDKYTELTIEYRKLDSEFCELLKLL